MPLAVVDGQTVEEWVGTFRAPRTRHAYRSDVHALYVWARKRHLVDHNPVDDTDSIRVPKGLPRPLPADAVRQVITTAPTSDLRLALALAIFAGLRRAEICALLTDDVALHVDRPYLTVRNGKWGKDRRVPLHPDLVKMLEQRIGRQGHIVHFTPDVLGRLAATHIRSCGHDRTLHSLRATFATELARRSNGNVKLVKELLGHETLNTADQYIGVWGIVGIEAVDDMYGGDAA